jgi:hypothetical protein
MNIHEQARAIIDDFAEIARQDRFGYDSGPFRAAAALRLASVLEGLRPSDTKPECPDDPRIPSIQSHVPEARFREAGVPVSEVEAEVRRGPGRPKKG